MEKNILIALMWPLCFSSISSAQEIIDLGTLEVEGEVRKPQVKFYSSKKVPLTIIKKTAEISFKELEEELLQAEDSEKEITITGDKSKEEGVQ